MPDDIAIMHLAVREIRKHRTKGFTKAQELVGRKTAIGILMMSLYSDLNAGGNGDPDRDDTVDEVNKILKEKGIIE